MVQRDVLEEGQSEYSKEPIFFKLDNIRENFKHVSSNKVFYQSEHFQFPELRDSDSLLFQVQLKRNCKMNVFRFVSEKRSRIFFLK